jgi:hypothetical protein
MKSSICLRPTDRSGPRLWPFLLALLALLPAGTAAAQSTAVRILAEYRGDLQYPTDVATDSRAWAYVVDGINQRLVVLDVQGALIREIRSEAFARPLGADISGDRLYVSDTGAKAIFIMDLEGRLLERIDLPLNSDPVDVLALDDKLVVSDNDNHRLLLVSYDGSLLRVVGRDAQEILPLRSMRGMELPPGRAGERVQEFKYPGILARHRNAFMVIDVLNARIQAYTTLGNFDRMIGSFGADGRHLFRPKGACACWDGRGTLVTDSYSGLIHAYDEFAEYRGDLTLDGEPWRLEGPTAIQCCGDSWWVVDCRGSRIVRFEIP